MTSGYKKLINWLRLSFILLLVFGSISCHAAAQTHIQTFHDVKKQAKIIWQDRRITFYCGCSFDKQLRVNHASCGYHPKDMKRAKRVEWEHLVPVSWFSRQRPCWRKPLCKSIQNKAYKGRDCCEKIDPEFKKMYFDLHNLVPAIGEVNKARSNFRFADMNLKRKNFQGCKLHIDDKQRIVVPKDELKGIIARAHLYMAKQYKFKLSHSQRIQFNKWNKKYPPSAWEREWNQRVKAFQGTDNTFISRYRYTR